MSAEKNLHPRKKRNFLSEINPHNRPKNVITLKPDQTPADYIAQELAKLGAVTQAVDAVDRSDLLS